MDNSLLEAIGKMLDEKLDAKFDAKLAPVQAAIDNLQNGQEAIQHDIALLQQEVVAQQVIGANTNVELSKLSDRIKEMGIRIEQKLERRIDSISDGHQLLQQKKVSTDTADEMQDAIDDLERQVVRNTKDIQALQRKVAP